MSFQPVPTPRTKLAPVVAVAAATKGDEESGIEESDDSHKKSSDKSGDEVDGDRSDKDAKQSHVIHKIEVLRKY